MCSQVQGLHPLSNRSSIRDDSSSFEIPFLKTHYETHLKINVMKTREEGQTGLSFSFDGLGEIPEMSSESFFMYSWVFTLLWTRRISFSIHHKNRLIRLKIRVTFLPKCCDFSLRISPLEGEQREAVRGVGTTWAHNFRAATGRLCSPVPQVDLSTALCESSGLRNAGGGRL